MNAQNAKGKRRNGRTDHITLLTIRSNYIIPAIKNLWACSTRELKENDTHTHTIEFSIIFIAYDDTVQDIERRRKTQCISTVRNSKINCIRIVTRIKQINLILLSSHINVMIEKLNHPCTYSSKMKIMLTQWIHLEKKYSHAANFCCCCHFACFTFYLDAYWNEILSFLQNSICQNNFFAWLISPTKNHVC